MSGTWNNQILRIFSVDRPNSICIFARVLRRTVLGIRQTAREKRPRIQECCRGADAVSMPTHRRNTMCLAAGAHSRVHGRSALQLRKLPICDAPNFSLVIRTAAQVLNACSIVKQQPSRAAMGQRRGGSEDLTSGETRWSRVRGGSLHRSRCRLVPNEEAQGTKASRFEVKNAKTFQPRWKDADTQE